MVDAVRSVLQAVEILVTPDDPGGNCATSLREEFELAVRTFWAPFWIATLLASFVGVGWVEKSLWSLVSSKAAVLMYTTSWSEMVLVLFVNKEKTFDFNSN